MVHHGFCFFPFLFFPLGFFIFIACCFIIVRTILFRRYRRFGADCVGLMVGPWKQGHDAGDILKRRLASGDITEEEYHHLRDLLKE